jgi:hypothetical protein
MDASLRELIPEEDFHSLVRGYYHRRAVRMRSLPLRLLRDGAANPRDWFDLQDRLLDDLRFRSSIVRRAAQVFEQTTSRIALFFARIFARTANVFLVAGVVLLLAALLQHSRAGTAAFLPAGLVDLLDTLPPLDVQVWFLILVTLFTSWRQFAVLSRRFRQQDVEGSDA